MTDSTNYGATRVALVTGGSRGIGRAIVDALLERGWRVHFCARTEESVARALTELQRYGGRVYGRAVDVGDQAQVDAFVAGVVAAEGAVSCLVNNAGLGHFAPVDEITGEGPQQRFRHPQNLGPSAMPGGSVLQRRSIKPCTSILALRRMPLRVPGLIILPA